MNVWQVQYATLFVIDLGSEVYGLPSCEHNINDIKQLDAHHVTDARSTLTRVSFSSVSH
jgi:hypothetical protein